MTSSLSARLKQKVTTFYSQDDVSRLMSGRKDTITRHKLQKQNRLLNDSLQNLHTKLCAEVLSVELFTVHTHATFLGRFPVIEGQRNMSM